MDEKGSMSRKIVIAAALLAAVVLGVGLALFALNGKQVRFWTDDYAYSLVAMDGFIEGTRNWYNYNGARLSSFWFVWIIDLFGMNAVRYLPGLTIALWVGSVLFFARNLLDLVRIKMNWIWGILVAVLLVYFSVLLMPTRLETLYWRMGTLHYTLPIALTLFNLGLIFTFMAKGISGIKTAFYGIVLLIIAFITGAHGEASGAWQVGVYLVAMALLWLYSRKTKQPNSMIYFVFALVGSILAIIVMAKSPANLWRMEAMPPPSSLGDFVYYTLRYSLDFVVDSIKTQPLPNLVFIAGSLAVSLAVLPATGLSLSPRHALIAMLASLVISFGLIVFSVSPSVYAGTNYPAPRALSTARFSVLMGTMSAAFFAAAVLRNWFARFSAVHWSAIIALLLVFVSLYTARSYRIPINEGRDLAVKAELWDKQDAQIKAAKQAGEMDVVIKQYDVVDTLNSFFDDPTHWLNQSAAVLYGVNSITAVP
ncbi:MAG: DUF6056 family protein [Bellilinea sp.]